MFGRVYNLINGPVTRNPPQTVGDVASFDGSIVNDSRDFHPEKTPKERSMRTLENSLNSWQSGGDPRLFISQLEGYRKLDKASEPIELFESGILQEKPFPKYINFSDATERIETARFNQRVFDWFLKGAHCIFTNTEICGISFLSEYTENPDVVREAKVLTRGLYEASGMKAGCETLLRNFKILRSYLENALEGVGKIDIPDSIFVQENVQSSVMRCNGLISSLETFANGNNIDETNKICKEIETNYFKLFDVIHKLPKQFREQMLQNRLDVVLQKLSDMMYPLL